MPGILQADKQAFTFFILLGGGEQKLHGIDGFAHIPTAGSGDVADHPFFQGDLNVAFPGAEGKGPAHRLLHILYRHWLKLKDGASAQNGVVYIKIGVFRGGGNEGDLPVFHEFQQGLLLFFIEILDLVQIEQHSLGSQEGVQLIHNGFDIAEGSGGGIEPVELPVGLPGDDTGQSGFAHAGGAVEDHVGNMPVFDQAAKNAVRADQMALAHHIVQGLGAQPVCQRFVHVSPVPPRSGRRGEARRRDDLPDASQQKNYILFSHIAQWRRGKQRQESAK